MTTPTNDERIASLEARLAAAEARIATLETNPYRFYPPAPMPLQPPYTIPTNPPWYPTWICGTLQQAHPDLRTVTATSYNG